MKTWTDFYTACEEHQRMGEMITTLRARGDSYGRNNALTFIHRTCTDCDACRSLTRDTMATWARTQASKKAPAPKYEGGWWYERINPDWRDNKETWWLDRWQKRYEDYMTAARNWAIS